MNTRFILVASAVIIAIVCIGVILSLNKKPTSNVNQITNQTNRTNSQIKNVKNEKKLYTIGDVEQHKDSKSCWTVIDGKVYDVTNFINQHLGGAMKIESLCGIDGSTLFQGQHGGQPRPNNELIQFYIGELH